MIVTALLTEMEILGIKLWVEAGQLRFQAPSGVLTEDHRTRLKAAKEDLIAVLEEQVITVVADPDKAYDPFPLTSVQTAYLVGRGDAFEYGCVGCHGYVELTLPHLEMDRMVAAWHTVITRHPMLRSKVLSSGVQQVNTDFPLPDVVTYDMRNMSDENIRQHIDAIRTDMEDRVYQPDQAPLYELRLSQNDDGGRLHLSIDLLIADFVSIQLLLSELDLAYHYPDKLLPAVDISFRDVVLAERAAKDTVSGQARYERDRQYWHQRLDTIPGAPEWPLRDHPEKHSKAAFVRHQAVLGHSQWLAVQDLARQQQLTPSGAVLTVFTEVLRRWSRTETFSLNVTVLNRPALHPDIQRVVGDFTQVSVLEVADFQEDKFVARARTLQQQLLSDLEHNSYTGVELIRDMARHNDRRGTLIPFVFTSTLGVGEQGDNDFMTGAELSYGISQTPQVWLDCQVAERGGELHLNWDVREDVFIDGVVEEAFDAMIELLSSLVDAQAWHHGSPLKLPTSQERTRSSQKACISPLSTGLLHEGFIEQVVSHPQRPAVVTCHQTYTYQSLAQRAASVARWLQAEGLTSAQPVAVCLPKSFEQIAVVMGILMAGGSYVPLNANQPRYRHELITSEAKITRLITDSSNNEGWSKGVTCLAIETLPECDFIADEWQLLDVTSDQLAYIIFTSGTTGKPKGVMISHQAALNTILDVNRRIECTRNDVVLGLAQLSFDLSVYDIFGTLTQGATLVLPEEEQMNNPAHWLAMMQQNQVTVWNSVPAQLQMLQSVLVDNPQAGRDIALRVAMLSGDWIPVTLPSQIGIYLPSLRLVSMGGATEAAIWSIWHDITVADEKGRSIPYGRPMDNQAFHILDAHLNSCPNWVAGEIYISGIGLALGYVGDKVKTAERFIFHPVSGERLYRTGDMGRYRHNGIIEFLGRTDTQVKVRGHRIELSEIDSVLHTHPQVGMAATVLIDDGNGDKRLASFVEAKRKATSDADCDEWASFITATGDSATADVDREKFAQWIACADQIALLDIMKTLQGAGLFVDSLQTYRLDTIIESTGTVSDHHHLVCRWVKALCREGWLEESSCEVYRCVIPYNAEVHQQTWLNLQALEAEVQYGSELLRYLRESAAALPQLLTGEVDPLALLFPQGEMDTALAAYNQNLVSRTMNRVAVTAAVEHAKTFSSALPMRVLEIGAGVGGTANDMIPALANYAVDYQFTDLSPYFLNAAQERYTEYPWVSFNLFDLNQPGWLQGQADRSLDMIMCANVLHNATHALTMLTRLRQMAAPGALIIIIEATREICSLMTSMEFQQGLKGFTDFRQHNGQTFITRDQWVQLFDQAGLTLLGGYPAKSDLMTCAGQTTFIVRVPDNQENLAAPVLTNWLSDRLPSYMIPIHMEVLEQLPLSPNGKVARQPLCERVANHQHSEQVLQVSTMSPLETEIAAIWSEALGGGMITRDQDFFMAGGDSLLIAQVVTRMREQLPAATEWTWDRLMREMLNTPTVSHIATVLIRKSAPMVSNDNDKAVVSPLVELIPAAQAELAGVTRVVIHDGSGMLTPYREIIAQLKVMMAPGDRLLGLTLVDNDTFLSHDSAKLLETLGAEYAVLLRTDLDLQGSKQSVQLIGYCMGGLIATEIARNLLEQGIESHCVVVSSGRFDYEVEDELLLERAFAQLLGANLDLAGHEDDDMLMATVLAKVMQEHHGQMPAKSMVTCTDNSVCKKYQRLAELPLKDRLQQIMHAMGDVEGNAWNTDHIENLYAVFRHSLDAVAAYAPLPYMGHLTVFNDDNSLQFLPGLTAELHDFWSTLSLNTAQQQVIRGDHISCMVGENMMTWLPQIVSEVAND